MGELVVNTLFRRSIKDIAIYFPGKLLPALTAFITIPIYARIFQPEDYGVLAIIGVLTSAGAIAIGNWLTTSVMRFLPQYRREEKLGQFYSTLLCAFILSLLVLGVLIIPLGLIVKGTVSPEVYGLLPLAILLIIVNTLLSILQTVLRADQRAKLFVGFELYNVYGALILGLTFAIALGFGVKGILLGSLIVTTTAGLGIGWWLLRHGASIKISTISGLTLREFATYGLPGGVATIGTWILSLSDRYIIEYFQGSVQVGLYSMGYSLADKSINLVVSSLMLAIGPILINAWESEHREATPQLLSQITRLTLLLVVPMVVGISVLAKPLFQVLTTEAYLPGASVLPWVGFGALLYALSLQAYTGLVVAKKMMAMARNYLLAGLINVLINIILVPKFGFMAAAVSTAVAYGVLLALNVFSATKYLPWLFPWRTLRNVLLASGTMALTLGQMRVYVELNLLTLLLAVAVGMSIYLLMLVITREFVKKEVRELQSMFSSLGIVQ